MTTQTLQHTTTRLPGLLTRRWDDLQTAWARHKRYRATLQELQVLSDRDLADLGMSRAMLPSVAWEASAQA